MAACLSSRVRRDISNPFALSIPQRCGLETRPIVRDNGGKETERNSEDMTEDTTTPLGRLLKRLRTEQGLSLYELAARSGLNRSTLLRIEGGTHAQPSAGTLNRLARGLGIDAEELYDASWVDSDEPLPSPTTYFRTKYKLSETQLAELESAIERITKGGNKTNGRQASQRKEVKS